MQGYGTVLTNFRPILDFYTPWKGQKTIDFSGGMEIEHWDKIVLNFSWREQFTNNKNLLNNEKL